MNDDATPGEARRALVQQMARQVLDLCKAHAHDNMDEAQTLGVLRAWLSDFARHTSEIRERAKHEPGPHHLTPAKLAASS